MIFRQHLIYCLKRLLLVNYKQVKNPYLNILWTWAPSETVYLPGLAGKMKLEIVFYKS